MSPFHLAIDIVEVIRPRVVGVYLSIDRRPREGWSCENVWSRLWFRTMPSQRVE